MALGVTATFGSAVSASMVAAGVDAGGRRVLPIIG
jgi:hypothetical protein